MKAKALALVVWLASLAGAQDNASASLRFIAMDPSGAGIPSATARLIAVDTHWVRSGQTNDRGVFVFPGLVPGLYELEVIAAGFATSRRHIKLLLGTEVTMSVVMRVAGTSESVTVQEEDAGTETSPSSISTVIDQREIDELPVNGRRFTDLALLAPQAVQDPRSLTSSSNGDLAFGGIRGFNTSYVVDGADNNNGFFAQSRGRLRAPYQFSNETIKEFRVSTNTFSAEQGRSSGAVVNVVTKSGTNTHHGSAFYYLRDGQFAATHPYVRKRYPDKQHQFGFSVGGPIQKGKIFYFAGFDQHIFHVPTVVQFAGGSFTVVASPADFEAADQGLVSNAASQLSRLGGQFRSVLNGNAASIKLDFHRSSRHQVTAKLSVSRYYGANNVFTDNASSITNFAISGNGEEQVTTETFSTNLHSVLGNNWINQARVQFSHDDQSSRANSDDIATKIEGVISGFGRSSILPRSTGENRWQIAETVNCQGARHALKFGGDLLLTRTWNYFARQFGGEYIFSNIKVNPFTFKPQLAGLPLTPLRAYAHQVPRYFMQDFGNATSRPNTNEWSLFVQDTLRAGDRMALTLGLRYDLQSFRQLVARANPVWPSAGRMPEDKNNFAPRIGIAVSFGDRSEPFVLRGGFGIFYPRIPQIYNSTVELEDGTRSHLFLDNANSSQRPYFPAYPAPIASCGQGLDKCVAPAGVDQFLTTDVSVFSQDFKTPYVQQASLSLEKRVAFRVDVTLSYLFVGGRHLIRARDVNLPKPIIVNYPIFDEEGASFSGDFYAVSSFGQWQSVASLSCPFPPCINDAIRPDPRLGAVNVFESAASNTYHGFTASIQRRMAKALSARLGYTWGKAIDDTQDALVAGRPTVVENPFSTRNERALSVVDQRHRFISSFSAEPMPFGRNHARFSGIFNDWRFSGIFSAGSGRPLTGHVTGDANRDGNIINDRLPGASRNSFTGPDYFSGEARITRRFHLSEQLRLEATAEAFNVFNRNNKRVETSDDGFSSMAASFVTFDSSVGGKKYPAQFRRQNGFLVPTNAYAPRQLQFSMRLKW